MPKTIVFVTTKDAAVKVYRLLHHSIGGTGFVSMFHASLTEATKASIIADFQPVHSKLRILVATVAFGMVGRGLHCINSLSPHKNILCRAWIFQILKWLLYMVYLILCHNSIRFDIIIFFTL